MYASSPARTENQALREARWLLVEFVRQAKAGGLSERLLEHMRDGIAAYLAGKKTLMPAEARDRPVSVPATTLEKALGLKRIAPG
ncbi:MAG: hypothetical protein ABJA83_13700, partial [Burkholderiaceae bacterium]